MFLRLTIAFLLISAFSAAPVWADAKSILIITWRGTTEAEDGFVRKLETLGVDADFEYFDARRSEDELALFLRDNLDHLKSKDLIYTFGTTASLTVQNFGAGGVPHVFNIVADPVGAGLVLSLDQPPDGLTGVKMSLSPDTNLDLLRKIYSFSSVAILFDPREPNAIAETDRLTQAAEALGIKAVRLRFSPDADEKDLQIAALKPQLRSVGALYVTASSSFAAHAEAIAELVPPDLVSIGSSTAYVTEGIMLAFGTEYRERGEAAARMAAKILLEKVPPGSLPVSEVHASEATLYIKAGSPALDKLNLDKVRNRIVYK